MLPPLLERWTESLLGAQPTEECEATCDDCVMKAMPGASKDASDIHFGDWKCCTYQPRLHNFLVGRILAEQGRAKDIVEELITSRSGVSPLGVYGPRTYWLLYEAAPSGFGRSSALRCPLFDPSQGTCGIWPHREATCATWFCKYDRGAKGQAFWEALRDLLTAMERALARALMLELDPGTEALEVFFSPSGEPLEAEELAGGASDAAHLRRWGSWAGREREFFRTCAQRAEAMNFEEVLAQGGVETRALARRVAERFRALRAPERAVPLRLGRFEVVCMAEDHVRLSTYSPFDPIEIPAKLLPALVRFDGRPTEQVIAEIAQQQGLLVTPEILRTLRDFGVLVEERKSP